ncbi:NAD+ synthase [Desulfobacca acetoxidans]|uniref:Glutamine-dependent NAD(+) synthetase n=1 Tax=Desulfobacca acetoxidans (strain ATCC 700848 / DSM 11109 / ASRB2) TaxID=880072 RepID=F2NGE7_DESAR|nr:NAD+ synthase [Desulfobacca acetoxidans]AEB08560.1 NAD+ synthetase [Desulfobacca acetoxidans DSM 11109]
MNITIAQLDAVVGDIDGNAARAVKVFSEAAGNSDLVVFPELYLTAYPPRDLLEKHSLINRVQQAVEELREVSARHPETGLLIGAPVPTGLATGKGLYNAALLIYQGQINWQAKSLLPTYDVFDESRYFDPPALVRVFPFKDEILGVSICEDAWYEYDANARRLYLFNPIQELAQQGATIFINISASPFHCGKEEIRRRLIQGHCQAYQVPFILVNQVGGNDELIFDGRSMVLDAQGTPVAVLPAFEEAVVTVDTSVSGRAEIYQPAAEIASVHDALILGLKDYLRKCGFSKAVVGLSGGIDSAVTCYLARQALGLENVLGVIMPSLYSSPGSIADSERLADNLGVKTCTVPITPIYQAYLSSLPACFPVGDLDVALENIQARIRGNILMAFSNRLGYMVLSTGNKSELAVGYCTLYGDMSGGLAVISDVPKTMIYDLARYINRQRELIPQEILTKPPSAELRPNQRDQDTLPPYEILDQILEYYINEGWGYQEIVDRGFDPETVRWVIQAVDRNEYKRRQAAPGLKVTSKAFGSGRRMPIAARYET